MNCNCIEFNEAGIVEHAGKNGVVNPTASPDFLGINFATGESVISLTYTVRGDNRPYNTQKGKSFSVIANYCPWCGNSLKKQA